jgi:hypothetical protein
LKHYSLLLLIIFQKQLALPACRTHYTTDTLILLLFLQKLLLLLPQL